jgi:hypothetical protein
MAGPKKRSDVTVDFSGVESGGRAVPDGEYLIECLSVEEKESQEGNAYLAWKWKVADGAYKGATVYDNTSLKPTALWRLKSLLECLGEEVDGKFGLNLGSYKGRTTLAVIANETYQGKQKPRITDFLRGIPQTSKSEAASGPKKGSKVTFEYEGAQMPGVVQGIEGGKVVVLVEVDGSPEEWELEISEVTLA